ncbi:hypothetical protein Patl1_21374 [Pistacia atlantica]|uniref:Uncharacterized protein n=1 Tax=Pistacia atlantica TaxID=434234 RepID=A0ACC1BLQ7_9ROSI|nr:hypothetical protein Patl1_21374 [Pistacia atlantica]
MVNNWIKEVVYIHRHRLHKLVIGLDTEWCLPSDAKYQNVAIIQLCVGCSCLIFQLCHKDATPLSLVSFLGNKEFTFVGKEVKNDITKLFKDHQLYGANVMDCLG